MLADAISTADNINDQANGVLARIDLANLELNLGQLPEARQHLNAALVTARQLNLKSSIAAILGVMGDLAVIEDQLDQAEKDYQQSLAIRTEIGERGGIASSWLSMAGMEMERKNLTKTSELAQQAIEELHNQHNDDQEAAARCYLARAEILEGNAAAAQKQMESVRQLKVQDRMVSLLVDTTEARLKAAGAGRAPAIAQLDGVIKLARRMKLPGYEYDARLAKSELMMQRNGEPALRDLAKEADASGFKLIARKAREAAVRATRREAKSQRSGLALCPRHAAGPA